MTRLEKSILIFIITFAVLCFIARSCYPEEIDDALINAIICVESGWDTNAVSPKGCRGLAQISEIVFKEFLDEENGWLWFDEKTKTNMYIDGSGLVYLYDPKINIRIATWYLNRLKDHYIPKDKFSLELLLSAYNGGITRLREVNWDWKKMPKQSKDYVKKVLKIYYGDQYGKKTSR